MAPRTRFLTLPRRQLAGQRRHHWIVAKLVVIDEVLVAERDAEHPLGDERRHAVLDELGPPRVPKARRETLHEPDRAIRRPQQ